MPTPKVKLGILAVIGLLGVFGLVGLAVIYSRPVIVVAAPLFLYAILTLGTLDFCRKIPRDSEQKDKDNDQSNSRTFIGLCFTSLSIVCSFYKTELQARQPGAVGILSSFSIALAFFLLSHEALRFRTKYFFFLFADAAVDVGFWCIFLGIWTLVASFGVNTTVFSLLMAFYFAVICFHFYMWFNYANSVSTSSNVK